MTQLALQMPVSARTVLVTVETVRAALGVDTETVWSWIDDGTIRWAWDISATPSGDQANRELRIWLRDVLRLADSPATGLHDQDLPQAIRAIIGHDRERVSAHELTRTLCCSRMHVHRLVDAGLLDGPMVGRVQFVTRPSLVRFLTNRHQ